MRHNKTLSGENTNQPLCVHTSVYEKNIYTHYFHSTLEFEGSCNKLNRLAKPHGHEECDDTEQSGENGISCRWITL